MKSLYKTLGCTAVLSAMTACGGSGGNAPDTLLAGTTDRATTPSIGALLANDGGDQSISLKGTPRVAAVLDLSIANPVVKVGGRSISYQFDITDATGSPMSLGNLSVALEVAAGGSFADSYRVPLYDISETEAEQGSGILSLTARSALADLPTGSYLARLVVNPNWQYNFDRVPQDYNDSMPYRYLDERDYQNNASSAFQIEVSSSTVCMEDEYEDNDTLDTATAIPIGGQVSASLCLDNVDFYSLNLVNNETTSLTFDYTDSDTNPNPTTRYVVLDSDFNRTSQPSVARESNRIIITAANAGQYYLALYGNRSSYRITRTGGSQMPDDFAAENIFRNETIMGPQSWMYGSVVLHRLAFTEALLNDQVVSCGRITTQFRDDQPIAYVTPHHFAGIHDFRFLIGDAYLIDGEKETGWQLLNGDISSSYWYNNDYPGYAEKLSNNSWRYWSNDGLAYVECAIQVNQ